MADKPRERDNLVRCVKCSLGMFSDGSRIGGLVSVISPGKGQCCHCGARYTIVAKLEKPYDPNKFTEQDVPF